MKKKEKETKVNKKISDTQSVDFNPTDLGKVNVENVDGFDPYDVLRNNLDNETFDAIAPSTKSELVDYTDVDSTPKVPEKKVKEEKKQEEVEKPVEEEEEVEEAPIVQEAPKPKKKIDYITLVLSIIAIACALYIIYELFFVK